MATSRLHFVRATAIAVLLAGSASAGHARADVAAPVDEARGLFVEGKSELAAGHAERALDLLGRSHALVPSPNTELLMGRALAALGRRVEATVALEHAEQEASRRVALGEAKYGATAQAARDEAAALRVKLGTVVVHLVDPGAARVSVDGRDVPVSAAGDAMVLHEQGPVEIVVRRGDVEQRQVASALAGGTLRIEFSSARATVVEERPRPAPAPAPDAPRRSWAMPLAIASGATALAGAGVFTVFGLKSGATYDALAERCGPRCGAADRPEADRGAREQTIANVGLVVGSAALVSFVTFLVLAPGPSARPARVVDEPARPTL